MEFLEYEIKNSNLNIENLIKDKQSFDYEVIAAYIKEYEKGSKVKKVSKTHRTGTTFTYIKIENKEEIDQYNNLLNEMIKEYNNKYDTQITINEFIG